MDRGKDPFSDDEADALSQAAWRELEAMSADIAKDEAPDPTDVSVGLPHKDAEDHNSRFHLQTEVASWVADSTERAIRESYRQGSDYLDLGDRSLRSLDGSKLADLVRVKHLDLYSNGLAALPTELGNMTQLVSLDISENHLRSLPGSLADLTSLEVLTLSNNALSKIPSFLFDLTSLRNLSLRGNHVVHISPRIAALRQLRELNFANNEIRDIPSSLYDLVELTTLDLRSNDIAELPDGLQRLSKLQKLDISDNRLKTLPHGLSQLKVLEELAASRNQLSAVPDDIGSLSGLRELYLSNNRLTSVPASLGELGRLEFLDLGNNELTTLPKELGNLNDTVDIRIDGNPLAEPLPSLVELGTPALLNYLRSLESSVPQYEAKLLLVGEGGVGKSSLIAALRGESFVENRPTTHGIELGSLILSHPSADIRLQLNSWDFGGQEVYRITHQFFFSRRSLYILVWKPREGQEENNIEAWCRRIRLRIGEDARIIIAASHADERRPEFDYEHLRSKLPGILVGYHAVDSESKRGLEDLRLTIAREASELPQMGELLGESWARVRERISTQKVAHISRIKFERICLEEGLDEDAAETLAALLHDLGQVIHYADDDGLRDLMVLKPEWLTKAIGYVLEDEETRRRGGVLDHSRLREIWSKGPSGEEGYPEKFHPYFLRLMEKFDVSYRLPDSNASLVGQLVPFERPQLDADSPHGRAVGDRRIRVVLRTAEEAPGLMAWLTVRNHRFSTGVHWRRGVLLSHEPYASRALLELGANNRDLILTVLAPSPDYFFHVVRDSIEELISQRWKGLDYQLLVPCGHERCSAYFSYRALLRFRARGEPRIVCPSCAEWSDVEALLTGFGQRNEALGSLLESIRVAQEVAAARLDRIEATGAETARHLRSALRILSEEVVDCPRLFTLAPADRSLPIRAISPRRYFILTLWCEEPGQEHPRHEASYEFHPPKQWIQEIGPYIRFVSRMLSFSVPVAGAIYAASVDHASLERIKADLDLSKVLAEKFPEVNLSSDAPPRGGRAMTRAEGAGLRALRQLVLKLDPSAQFGQLRRIRSTSGDLLWVCPRHYTQYDPGLPQLSK